MQSLEMIVKANGRPPRGNVYRSLRRRQIPEKPDPCSCEEVEWYRAIVGEALRHLERLRQIPAPIGAWSTAEVESLVAAMDALERGAR